MNVIIRDEFERKLDDNGKRLKGIEMELIDTKAALSSTLQNMGQRFGNFHLELEFFYKYSLGKISIPQLVPVSIIRVVQNQMVTIQFQLSKNHSNKIESQENHSKIRNGRIVSA